ncbi:hypothetical protein CEXT_616681 [Caerostris extrusa]|uniref:Uncharacterized protein n=1 Tax=Caerostris extrusa TaxID=172846 RepID=A0AAV4N3P3_CAEEX|nr:hypothetical protein CEXT_616681 [Caerostris extrusa]
MFLLLILCPNLQKDDNADDENIEVSSTVVEVSDCAHTNPDLQFLDKFLKQDSKDTIAINTIPSVNEKKCLGSKSKH